MVAENGMQTLLVPDEVMEGLKVLYRDIRNSNEMTAM
jgi:hypothetical protein